MDRVIREGYTTRSELLLWKWFGSGLNSYPRYGRSLAGEFRRSIPAFETAVAIHASHYGDQFDSPSYMGLSVYTENLVDASSPQFARIKSLYRPSDPRLTD